MATRTAHIRADAEILLNVADGDNGSNNTTGILGWDDVVTSLSHRLVARFDLKLKHGTITAATLTLQATNSAASGVLVQCYPIKNVDRNWIDSQATWDDKRTATAWGAAGGNPDTGATPVTSNLTTDGADVVFGGSELVAICQTAIDQGGMLDLVFKRATEGGTESKQTFQQDGHASGPATLVLTFTDEFGLAKPVKLHNTNKDQPWKRK